MPTKHAVLSPSASARWLSCPASVRLVEKQGRVEVSSPYAEEGTQAHSLGELKARLAFGQITPRTYVGRYRKWEASVQLDADTLAEMHRHTDAYVNLLRELVEEYGHGAQVMLEQRLNSGIPSCWGTSDAVVISPTVIHIVDFKYGQGVSVSAEENPQTRLYALGALDTFGDVLGDTEHVRMTIHQPRLDSISTEELSVQALLDWRESIMPIAAEALAGSTRFGPSEKACRFCPVAGECVARVEAMTAIDFAQSPDLLSPEDLGDLIKLVPEIRRWCDDVMDTALRKAYSEHTPIPGWKVVLSRGTRYIPDATAAIQTLIDAGFKAEQVANFTVKGIGELEKLVGKKELPDVLGSLLEKRAGKPSLAPESDPRPAISPELEAAKDFS